MEILSVDFKSHALLEITGKLVKIKPFKGEDSDIVNVGIDAPKTLRVNREEVQLQLKESKNR